MKKIAAQAAGHLARLFGVFDVRDLFLAIGLALSAWGLSMVWLPAAFIFPGIVLTYLAVFVGKE